MTSRRDFLRVVAAASGLPTAPALSQSVPTPPAPSPPEQRTRGLVETKFVALDPDPSLIATQPLTTIDLSDVADSAWSGVWILNAQAPVPSFADATHDLYVLRGDLMEGSLRHRVGTYLRRVAGASLTAGSRGASVLAQRVRGTREHTATIRHEGLAWRPGAVDGLRIAPLASLDARLSIVAWHPGTRVSLHEHARGEEFFVLHGSLCDQRGCYPAGTWQRLYPGAAHAPFAEVATLILLRNGHLRP